jgi:hypothetical protein
VPVAGVLRSVEELGGGLPHPMIAAARAHATKRAVEVVFVIEVPNR